MGLPIDISIAKHGKDNFSFEIIEECKLEELNEKESYWIKYYNSNSRQGYNCNCGGDQASIGEQNGNAKITEEDVVAIRTMYKNHTRKKEAYQIVKDKITESSFESVWEGATWQHIMPEVYTEKNKMYYSTGEGCISNNKFSDEEVLDFRKQYVDKSAREIYQSLDEKKVSYESFQKMLIGTTYKHLPYYSKTYEKWFDLENPAPKAYKNRGNVKNHYGQFTDDQVISFRTEYIEKTAKEIYEKNRLEQQISFDGFSKMLRGKTYKHLPYYSKTKKTWIKQ